LLYHVKTIQLLGLQNKISASALNALNNIERRIKRTLPASVREWYELENAVQLLFQYSNADPPLDIEKLGESVRDTLGGGPYDLVAQNFLVIRHENQCVCVWAVMLDGSDDPAVVLDLDTQFKTWTKCASSFSEHIYAWIWDYSQVLSKDRFLIQAQNSPLSEIALSFLHERFEKECVTYGWPGRTQHRFYRGDQRILIWADDKQADWWLNAQTKGSLEALVNIVAPLDLVGKAFWSNDAEGQVVLESVRGSQPTS
jgi:hypothetical protein